MDAVGYLSSVRAIPGGGDFSTRVINGKSEPKSGNALIEKTVKSIN